MRDRYRSMLAYCQPTLAFGPGAPADHITVGLRSGPFH